MSFFFFFSSRRRHTRSLRDWSSDVCSSDLIDPSKDRNTFLLMLVARKIGEYVAMGLKDHFQMRRPAQVYPLIMPLIDGPDKIGRASCREREWVAGAAVSSQSKKPTRQQHAA